MSRIVLLYADTGGGHRSAAEAIASGFDIVYPGRHEVALVNAISHMTYPYDQMERSYPAVVNGPRLLHQFAYHATNSRRRSWIVRALLRRSGETMARFVFDHHPADIYVSCSPIYTQVIPYYLRQMGNKSLCVVVTTELISGHAFNYAPEANLTLVSTEYTRSEAISNRVAPDRIMITGQPVWPDLQQRVRTVDDALRADFGFDGSTPLALMIGGGDGMGRLGKTACAIVQSDLKLQLLVVCGRNEAVRRELDELPVKQVRMKTTGFISTVPELMGIADILVTKGGPGTLAEGFIAGLPLIIYDAVPGQEDGNVTYVVKNGAGAWCPSPIAVISELRRMLTHPASMATMRQASRRLARPDSALDIARRIGEFGD